MAGVGTMSLTKHADELCFEESIFLEAEFNAERFVSACRRRVTLEHLRVDLEAFFKTLKAALVELINSDYADFVSLSAKLVGPPVGQCLGGTVCVYGFCSVFIARSFTVMRDLLSAVGLAYGCRQGWRALSPPFLLPSDSSEKSSW